MVARFSGRRNLSSGSGVECFAVHRRCPIPALSAVSAGYAGIMRKTAAILVALATVLAPTAVSAKPKLGPNAVPITSDHAFLQTTPAPDYWAYSPFDKPQFTGSACSVASVTMALNGLRGLPGKATAKVPTQAAVLKRVGNRAWKSQSAAGGSGVTFAQLRRYTRLTLDAYAVEATVSAWRTEVADADALVEVREILARNEASADDVALIYFNQGVLTGDWNGPHVSVIGAYDAATDRVLVLDVDQDWYIPYWSPVSALVDSFVKPAPKSMGSLAGQTGGIVTITKTA